MRQNRFTRAQGVENLYYVRRYGNSAFHVGLYMWSDPYWPEISEAWRVRTRRYYELRKFSI